MPITNKILFFQFSNFLYVQLIQIYQLQGVVISKTTRKRWIRFKADTEQLFTLGKRDQRIFGIAHQLLSYKSFKLVC
ncbi:hypothetical protein C5167_000161 [Papaver somniferum]|uniref:Uncharacterized protein n=1 Tax=Papaver somniferum TaxID=3469 RepID=A0A4Y7KVH4_PAPSO|nr:hypothetical protein C5167_000161 [Papaver somniferum]